MIAQIHSSRAKKPKRQQPGVSVVIPAYNEEETILRVINVAERHSLVDEIIVVSDGSNDRTASLARETSARVIELPGNQGKGIAMNTGVNFAKHEIIVFLDADLVGLTGDMLSALIEPILGGRCEMFILVRDRIFDAYNYLPPSLILGGERALTKEFWFSVPMEDKRGFDTEIALNYYARKFGFRSGALFIPGLQQVIKEKKRGIARGFTARVFMFFRFTSAYLKLHLLHFEGKTFNKARQTEKAHIWPT